MRSQKPFKFNKSSKSHMSHKKCNESVSPSPSSKRNKRNSSFDSPSPGRKKTPDIDDKRRSRHSSETRGKSSGRINEKRSRDSSTDSRDERRGRSCTRKGNRSCNKRSNRSYSRDHKRKSVREELSEINSKLDHLVEEVLIIKKAQLGNNTATTNQYESVSPKQTFLMQHAAIDEEQCKSFRNEVFQILSNLDSSLFLDYTKSWNEIQNHVIKETLPTIDKSLSSKVQYNSTELKNVLQQLHRLIAIDEKIGKFHKILKKLRRTKNEREQILDKKERRKQGLQYMYTTKSPTFVHLRPDSLTVEKYEKDLEEIVDNKAYHSDEISETDEEMAMKEINELVRPKNKLDKHVIHVYNKP
ncbi:hypothetical protein GLOIN_2v1792170 [Rhizophagus irregularis DAOM 181602=DAOM 197198]|nr:hypothetical protein GLOIN_2v1792170 [Rhizophagus irregularis DAOM 181602=DAOM 197198]